MPKLKKYKKNDGTEAWMISGYLGTDPRTNRQVRFRKRNFSSEFKATAAYFTELREVNRSGFINTSLRSFQAIYELWLSSYKFSIKESSLVKLEEKFENHILPFFGQKNIDQITVQEIQLFVDQISQSNLHYKEYASNVSRVFKFAILQGFIKDNPADKITLPRPKKKLKSKPVKYFTPKQLNTFLKDTKEHEDQQIFTFFHLMAHTGVRTGELLGLKYDAIDFSEQTVQIYETLTRGKNRRLYLEEPKTVNARRTIPIDDETTEILLDWQRLQYKRMKRYGIDTELPDQLVFCTNENKFIELTHPRLWMIRICKRAHLRSLTPHCLRHTFASILLSNGVNYKTLSQLLGHSSTAFTMDVYGDVYKKDKIKTILDFSRALERDA